MARTVKMIDVSKWQASDQRYPPVQPMDWAKAAAQGVEGAYIKASEGLSDDPEVERNNALAGVQNIKRGPYHFFRPWYTGLLQAQYFLSVVSGLDWEKPPALDVEVECTAKELWAFVKHVHAETGEWAVIYTSLGAWGQVIDGRTISGLRITTYKTLIAEHCDLWQAQYPNAEYDDGYRIIPPDDIEPWAKLKKPPVIHQYSARNKLGPKYGSVGSKGIDLDLADDAWFSLWPWPAAPMPEPEPEPEPDPGDDEDMKTRFIALIEGQNVRSEPSTSGGRRTVVGQLRKNQGLGPARDAYIKSASEVWLKFDIGWVAATHGGTKYLEAK